MGVKGRLVKFYCGVSDRSDVVHLISNLFSGDGGPGSGNFGHAGRPNQVGGSSPSGGAESGEELKKRISKLSRFGEQGEKRRELTERLNRLTGQKTAEGPKKPKNRPKSGYQLPETNFPVTPHKEAQFEIIQKTNPMKDDYHQGIRKPSDIMSAEEAFNDDSEDAYVYPDFTREDGKKALETGEITVYSSYPIENGVFVSPSEKMASDYAGDGKVYKKTVPVGSVAWINAGEGQFADVVHLASNLFNTDGGPGSGNHHHAGRPGHVGGSAPRGGGSGFSAIASAASNTFDAAEFVAKLDAEQKERLKKQKRDTETEETFEQYAGRLQKAIKDPPKAPSAQHSISDGKDIVSSYRFQGEADFPDATVATKRIDTLIEDVIHQQGFDGVPKVVSKEEFEKITEEHPEMPILLRTYAASNQEKLDEYSNDLESGFFYVDCGVGGKSYGSGMYTAGAYQGDPASEVLEWDDRELETDELGNWFPLKIKGEGYRAKAVFPEEAGELFVGIPYVYESFKDGERHIYTMDEESLMWEDENGSLVPEEDLNEMIRLGEGTFYECEKMDLSVYYDKQNRDKQEALQEASREMDKYVQSSLTRVWNYEKPKTPPGMALAREESEQQYYYYDPSTLKDIKENPPEDGKIIAVAGKEGESTLYRVKGNKIMKLDGSNSMAIKPQSFEYPVPDGWKWAEVGGKIEDYNPVATVRKMTLDPSAKIVSSADLFDIINGNPTRNELEDAIKSYFDKSVEGKTPDEIEYMRFTFGYPGYKEFSESNAFQTLCKKIDRSRRDELYEEVKTLVNSREAGVQGVFDMAKEREIMIRNRFQIPGDRIKRQPDQGVVAAALGYDAISANLTEKLNYTIVLNRTKVIVQKEAA